MKNFSRRRFVKLSATTIAGLGILGYGTCPAGATPTKNNDTLRVIGYNTFLGTPWPSGSELAVRAYRKGQMPTRLALELALYDPDIITFAESPRENIVKEIANLLDMDYAFFPSAGKWPGAILTRHEILDAQNVPILSGQRPEDLFTRHWGKALIRLADGEHITVHSVHLYPHDNSESRRIREREIAEVLRSIPDDAGDGRSALILGDLNHTPSMPEYAMWTSSGWVDTFMQVGKGNGGTARPDEPSRRIDYVWVRGPLSERVVESRPLFEGAFRTNPADSNAFALSDHLPQFAAFEIGKQ